MTKSKRPKVDPRTALLVKRQRESNAAIAAEAARLFQNGANPDLVFGRPAAAATHVAQELTTRHNSERPELTCRTASTRADSVDEENRSIEAIFATERVVTVLDRQRYQLIDEVLLMDGAQLPDQLVMLDDHFRWGISAVLGSGRSMQVEAAGDMRQLVGRLHFAEGEPGSVEAKAWNLYRQRHARDVSIGYVVHAAVDIEPGESETVNGKNYTAGARRLRVATQWSAREISLTPVGADAATKTRRESEAMNKKLRAYLESLGLRSDATEEQAWAYYHGLEGDQRIRANGINNGTIVPADTPEQGRQSGDEITDSHSANAPAGGERGEANSNSQTDTQSETTRSAVTQPATTAPAISPEEAARQAVNDERQRVRSIRELGADLVSDEMIERAISDGWTTERANTEFLQYVRNHRDAPIEGAPAGHVFQRERHMSEMALAAGLMHRTGTVVIGAEFRQRDAGRGARMTEEHADYGDRYSSWSMVDLARAALQCDGRHVPHDRDEMIRAAFSTTALANIFTTSIHARLLNSYEEAEDTTDWCSVEDLTNYQTVERAALGKTGRLRKVGRGGTAKDGTIDDSKEEYKLARYGEKITIDEMDFDDDNLDGLQRLPVEMGLAAANLRPDLVYSIVLANAALGADSIALFHSDHNNTDTNALSLGNIGAGATAMMQQTQASKRLNIRPRFLVVPGDLEFSAREFVRSTKIQIAGTAGSVTVRGDDNVIKDLDLQLRVEGRIDAAGVTDPDTDTAYTGSATNWFLFSAAGRTIVVGYKAGTMRRPQVRRYVLDKGQWGMGWDIKHSIGAKALDFRGCYRGNS